jgi:hypothetical protein
MAMIFVAIHQTASRPHPLRGVHRNSTEARRLIVPGGWRSPIERLAVLRAGRGHRIAVRLFALVPVRAEAARTSHTRDPFRQISSDLAFQSHKKATPETIEIIDPDPRNPTETSQA